MRKVIVFLVVCRFFVLDNEYKYKSLIIIVVLYFMSVDSA